MTTPRRFTRDYPATTYYLAFLTFVVFVLAVLQATCR